MREKVVIKGDSKKVIYTQEHWKLLFDLRNKAKKIMKILEENGIKCLVHGSIARGDVHKKSDIDILIPYPIPSYRVEIIIEEMNMTIVSKRLMQATPLHVMKAQIELQDNIILTFPLFEMRKLEREFYKFGGEADLQDLMNNVRKPGVSKKLLLIEPIEEGHIESPVIGREEYVSEKIGVSIDIVKERVRVLTRRDKIGRTGVYFNYILAPDENFEEAFKRILDREPAIRRRLFRI